ncbi:MAG: CHAT domain-containing protein [Kouleothrix sp.]|nr:CHAT domain-containing protein [Kouleothrix sp.]
MPRFLNFDLAIASEGKSYTVQVRDAFGVGDLKETFIPPFDLAVLPAKRHDAAQWIDLARISKLKSVSQEILQAREFGTELFKRLFVGEISAAFRESRAKLQDNEHLCLRLHLPPLLAMLPWELLYDQTRSQFLALAPDLALVRYPELSSPIGRLSVDEPLHLVVILASPISEDYRPLNIERELRRIEQAVKELREQGRIILDVISGPSTLDQLRGRLSQPVHILHVLCHGDLDTQRGEGELIFEDYDSTAERINAVLFRQYLSRQRGQTKVVFLNACLSALSVDRDPLSSVGVALIDAGVSAVIAMQFELPEDAAAELTRVFYAELAMGKPIEQSLALARQHLSARYPSRLDWAIPVLFLRADDGVLFQATGSEIKPSSSIRPQRQSFELSRESVDQATIETIQVEALIAFRSKDWPRTDVVVISGNGRHARSK